MTVASVPIGVVPSPRAVAWRGLLTFVAVVLLAAGIYRLQVAIDRVPRADSSSPRVLYFQDGRLLTRLALGFRHFFADLYWLRAVQLYGRHHMPDAAGLEDLATLLDLATDLDPRLEAAYTYGAAFLAHMGPSEARQAVALVDKGIRADPANWRLYLYKGFVFFHSLGEHGKAAEAFLEGSRRPGAPEWLKSVAGLAFSRGGDPQTARQLWRGLYETAENAELRQSARGHLARLDALDQLDYLQTVVARFEAQAGRFPLRWNEVIAAGLLPAVPMDPTGTPYELEPSARRVTTAERSPLGHLQAYTTARGDHGGDAHPRPGGQEGGLVRGRR